MKGQRPEIGMSELTVNSILGAEQLMNLTSELGPETVLRFSESDTGFEGMLVIDNTDLGPPAGGVRITPDISEVEILALARTMTLKHAICGIPMGGAKAGLKAFVDSTGNREVIRRFAQAVSHLVRRRAYHPGTDIGTDEEDIRAIYRECGIASHFEGTTLALTRNGIPLGRIAVAYGVAEAIQATISHLGLSIREPTVALEGLGKIGTEACKEFMRRGFRVVAAATVRGTVSTPRGIDLQVLLRLKENLGDEAILKYARIDPTASVSPASRIMRSDVDVLVPGARAFSIDHRRAKEVRAKIVTPIANFPVTLEAEDILFRNGVVSIPDIVSNSGNAVASWVNSMGGNEREMFSAVRRVIHQNVREILTESASVDRNPKLVAMEIAKQRILRVRQRGPLGYSFLMRKWRQLMSPRALNKLLPRYLDWKIRSLTSAARG